MMFVYEIYTLYDGDVSKFHEGCELGSCRIVTAPLVSYPSVTTVSTYPTNLTSTASFCNALYKKGVTKKLNAGQTSSRQEVRELSGRFCER